MKKNRVRIVVFLVIFAFFFCSFSLNVAAEELNEDINNDVLNSYSDTINFLADNIAVVKGSLRNNLNVSEVIGQINFEGLSATFGVNDISIIDSNGNVLNDTSTVTSDMKLVFTTDNNNFVYTIIVVGDINNDGIVNNIDATSMVDSILNNGAVSVTNDLNNDGIFDVLDVTHAIYSITNNSWDNNISSSDILYGELANNSSIYIGEEIEVKYTIHGFKLDSINGIEGMLNYDTNLLQLVGVTINNQYGNINNSGKFLYILENYVGCDVLLTFKFKAIAVGDANVSIDNINAAMNGIAVNIDDNSIYTNIKIENYGTGGDGFDDVNDNDSNNVSNVTDNNVVVPVNNKKNNTNVELVPTYLDNIVSRDVVTYVQISSNNYIDSLKIKGYDIKFDKDTLEYSIDVGSNVDSLDLDIILSDNVASYEVFGNEKFKSGKNVVTIEVTAEDGSIRTYTINVNKKKISVNKSNDNNKDKVSDSSRVVIIILIILVIIGLIYVIFKDDEEEEMNNNKDKE